MVLVKKANQLLLIYEDLQARVDEFNKNTKVYDFDQTWGSTALNLPEFGGSVTTTERTYTITNYKIAYIYFGG